MSPLIVVTLLLALCSAQDFSISNCTFIAPVCDQPENCGGSPPGCGCNCAQCGSCVQSRNPLFRAECKANVVLILDESASIQAADARDAVVLGARSFIQTFARVNEIGGTANLAVVEFSDEAAIIQEGLPIMYRLTPAKVAEYNTYLDAPCCAKNSPWSYDPQYGCTNWQAVLQLVAEAPWQAQSFDTSTLTETRPDLVLWFTDGAPTVHAGSCDLNCNAGRERQSSPGLVGNGNGGDVGGACFWADKIKSSGTKLFLIGIGQVSDYIPNVQLVTGPNVWDPSNEASFPGADYVLNLDYTQLITFFYEIARGLCRCLQDQAPCVSPPVTQAPPCFVQTQFDARVRIHGSATSITYPANSLVYGYIYYRFGSGTDSRYAVDIQQPGVAPTQTGEVIRTDVYEPCKVVRRIVCGDQCFSVSDKSFMPRFFLAEGDVQQGPPSGFTSRCGTAYHKTSHADQPGSIEYVWMTDDLKLCAARDTEGTLYEFFQDCDTTAPGVNYRTPVELCSGNRNTTFNFTSFDNCQAKQKCNARVDLLYVVDGSFTPSDYNVVKLYVQALLSSYDDSNPNVRAAVVLRDSYVPLNGVFSADLAGVSAAFGDRPQDPLNMPFRQRLSAAIDNFWPSSYRPNVDPPRYMLTIVGGPDADGEWTALQRATFNQLKQVAGVESWAVGVAEGALHFQLLSDIGDEPSDPRTPPVAYSHVEVLGSVRLLSANYPDQATRMCPTSDLCGDDCLGLCVCGQCICPECVGPDLNDKCYTNCCDVTSKACSFARKEEQIEPFGCLPGGVTDPGIKYTCAPDTGVCGVDTTCQGRSGCSVDQLQSCQFNKVDTLNCKAPCNPVARQCNCNDLCGSQCNGGFCTGILSCDDANPCTSDHCAVRNINGKATAVCEVQDNSAKICPSANPCVLSVCNYNSSVYNTTDLCVAVPLTSLIDVCGVCNGDNLSCFFTTPSGANTGAIIGGVIGGVAAAALAAALMAWARQRGGASPNPVNALENAALQSNPTYAEPGMGGDMPTL